MVGIGFVLIVAVVLAVVFLGRKAQERVPGARESRGRPVAARLDPEVEAVLARAVGGGLLTQEAADAIAASELAGGGVVTAAGARRRSVPAVAEALGYVGGILVLVGMIVVLQRVWDDLTTPARLAVAGGAAGVLLGAGLLLRDEADEVVWRLRGFLWLLAAGAVAGFVAILTMDGLGWDGEPVAVAIGATVAAFGLALWQRKDRPAQQLTTFVGLLVMLGGALAPLEEPAAIGIMILLAGACWLELGRRLLLPPQLVALGLGAAAMLVGPAVMAGTWEEAAPVVGLGMATLLVALGTRQRHFLLTGAGVVGLFAYLPWTLGALFGDAVGPPVILLGSGLLLLAVMFVLLRRSHHGPGLGGLPPALG